MNGLALRVAMRQVYGAFFNVGDIILFGKYKNKKGKIISFSKNEKGQPLVEIEPIPKGRKQNKIMGLFKIWNLSVIEKAQESKEASMDPMSVRIVARFHNLSQRVASRFLLAQSIPMGKTVDKGDVRIHRFMDLFKITDTTNAGKRGKRCRVMTISPSYSYKGNRAEWMDRMSKALPDYSSFDKIDAFLRDILVDYPGEITINRSEERGVDVNPGGTTKIEFDTVTSKDTSIEVTALPDDFSVIHRWKITKPGTQRAPNAPANDGDGDLFQDTNYGPVKKADAQVFYNWLSANLNEAKQMDIGAFRKLWDTLKIRYDYH